MTNITDNASISSDKMNTILVTDRYALVFIRLSTIVDLSSVKKARRDAVKTIMTIENTMRVIPIFRVNILLHS